MRARLSLLCTVIQLIAVLPAAGQARVEKIIPQPPQVSIQRAGAVGVERALAGTMLLPGDVVATRDLSLLELRCEGQSGNTYRLKGPFRVLIDVPIDTTCHVNLLAGRGDVIAEAPSATTAGGISLGSVGTQYSVEVTRQGDQLVREVAVFEGAVLVRGGAREVAQGSQLQWVGREVTPAPLSPTEIERSAEVYARFDAAAAVAAEPATDPAATYQQLRRLHYDVLANPTDTAKRVELAKRQIRYKANYQAAYNLRRANVTNDAALRRHEIDPSVIQANPTLRDGVYRAPTRPAARYAPEASTREATGAREGEDIGGALQLEEQIQAMRDLESRVTRGTASSRDYYAVARAYTGYDEAKVLEHARRALILQASDGKLTPVEVGELNEMLGRR